MQSASDERGEATLPATVTCEAISASTSGTYAWEVEYDEGYVEKLDPQ
jgi:hypothetical protein